MRNAFAAELSELAEHDERIMLLSGDIGNRLFDDFKARFPDRFMNCGVAEANMIGVAAGLALNGMRPIAYTITPFVTTRCLEQIRVDICYHHLPVTVVGVGGGLSYAGLGATHHSCEDIAFLRALPNMTVVCPGDSHEVRGALAAVQAREEPAYIRLGKKGEPLVHESQPEFELGRAITVRPGADVAVLACGNVLPMATEVADALAAEGVDARVLSFHTVKPLDEATLLELTDSMPLIVTLEEHSLIGGFGSAIAEWAVDRDLRDVRILRVGTRDEFIHEAGGQDHARAWYGLTSDAIASRALAALREVAPARA